MITPDDDSRSSRSDVTPHPNVLSTCGEPPLLPPPLPPVPKPGNRPGNLRVISLVICLAFVAALAIFLTGAMLLRGDKPRAARFSQSEPGVTHKNDRVGRVPWSIHIVKIDRSAKDLAFFASLAKGTVLGVSKISEQARAVPREVGHAIAGVNADFYERDNRTYAGDPRGLQIVDGELVSAPSTACVWFDTNGNPHVDEVKGDFKVTWPGGRKAPFGLNQQRRSNMAVLYTPTYGASTRITGGRDLILERDGDGPWLPLQAGETYRARVREIRASADTQISADTMVLSLSPQLFAAMPTVEPEAVLEISTATTPDLKGVRTAIAGGPVLIQDGKPFSGKPPATGGSDAYSERSKYERHPRSAVGWNATHVYLLTVDGRQPGLSLGMTLAELANYMVKLGCTDGMNFDGGASASMWMSGAIVSSPCQGERPVANALYVVRKPAGR